MNGQRKLAALAMAAGLVLTAAACSDDDDGATKTVTGPNGEQVEVSKDGSSVKVKDKDGNTYEVNGDSDGSGSVKDSDGNESDFSTGNTTKLPEDWPKDLKPPKGVTLVSSYSSTMNGKKTRIVSAETKASAEDIYEGIKQQLTDADYEITSDYTSSGTAGSGSVLAAKNDDYDVSVTVGETNGKTTIAYSVTDADKAG